MSGVDFAARWPPAAKRERRPVASGFPKYANRRRQRPHPRCLDFYSAALARKHANTLRREFGADRVVNIKSLDIGSSGKVGCPIEAPDENQKSHRDGNNTAIPTRGSADALKPNPE